MKGKSIISHSDVIFEERKQCILCNSNQPSPQMKWIEIGNPYDYESKFGQFKVIRCRTCQLGFTSPFPTPETTGYLYEAKKSGDFDIIKDSYIDQIKDWLAMKLFRELKRDFKCPPLAILDYSTGNGRFALAAAHVFRGAKVDAVDYQEIPPPLLAQRQEIEVNVKYSFINTFRQANGFYDLVILRHVLEHTHDPVALLKELKAHLTPQGMIYVEVPNLDSGCRRVFRDRWRGYYVPRHIFHYNPYSLLRIASEAGLDATLGTNEMPLMGNTFANILGGNKSSVIFQGLGVVFHPLQILIEFLYRSSGCINMRCTPASQT